MHSPLNKPFSLNDLIFDNKFDLLHFSETRLSSDAPTVLTEVERLSIKNTLAPCAFFFFFLTAISPLNITLICPYSLSCIYWPPDYSTFLAENLSSIVVTYKEDGGETFMIGAYLKAKGWWDTLVLIASLSPWRVCMFGLHLESKWYRYTLDMCPLRFFRYISPIADLEGVATMSRWCGHWDVLKCQRSLTACCFSVVLGTEKCQN